MGLDELGLVIFSSVFRLLTELPLQTLPRHVAKMPSISCQAYLMSAARRRFCRRRQSRPADTGKDRLQLRLPKMSWSKQPRSRRLLLCLLHAEAAPSSVGPKPLTHVVRCPMQAEPAAVCWNKQHTRKASAAAMLCVGPSRSEELPWTTLQLKNSWGSGKQLLPASYTIFERQTLKGC